MRLAALLSHMGYRFRVVRDPLGTQFLFADPGDIGDAIEAYERGDQVASAKDLLLMYDTFLVEMKGTTQKASAVTVPMGEGTELVPTTIETKVGREWTTGDFNTANLLCYRGNELLRTYLEEGRTKFVFSYDDGLTEAVSLFNKKKLRVDPHEWALAGFKVRDAVREVRQR